MKIKDTLDLCGWELWNFCIQNHQNLEGLLDLGAGRKVFYTGNDQGKNGREVIYDGSKWKVSAYMSDVDELRGLITVLENATDEEIEALKGRATTTEGNLATLRSEFDALNKALNDDTAGTIDTWNEIQNFVGKYDGSEDLETILSRMNTEIDGKLDLAGGTMKDASTINWGGNLVGWDDVSNGFIGISNFKGDSTFGYYVGLSFKGYYGFQIRSYGGGDLYEVRGHNSSNWGTWRTLLHSGNYSDYALPLTGGTITGRLTIQGDGTAWLHFQSSTQNFGSIGVNETGPKFWDGASASSILHSGNYATQIGDYYLKTTGGTIDGNLQIGTNDNTQFNHLTIVRSGKAIRLNGYGTEMGLSFGSFSSGGTFTQEYQITMSNYGLQYKEFDKTYSILHVGNYSDLITTLNNNLNVPSITIGGIRLSVENGLLKIEGSAFATGELAAGGAATEGNGGAGGFSLYESWGTSAPTEPLALGANLGYELKTRVEDLELAKTKVTFESALVSGKQIGTIEIDGNKTNLFAPATYAWSEITGTENVLLKSGGTITGVLTAKSAVSVHGRFSIYGLQEYRTAENHFVYVANNYYTGSGDGKGLAIYTDSRWYDLLHSGNVGDYALKIDGSNAMAAGKYINWEGSSQNGEDYESFGYGIRLLSYSTSTGNYRGGLSVGTRYGFQLTRLAHGDLDLFTVRFNDPNNNNAWGDWKTIAFTDSDITGNASGLKYKDASMGTYYLAPYTYGFSLEGQYATLRIKGTNIYNSQIEFADNNDIVRWALSYRGANNADKDFCFTKLNEDGVGSHIVALNYSSGNVLIGTITDNGSGAKLQVAGGATFDGALSVASTIYLKRNSHNYIWASEAGGLIHLGVKDTADAGIANASLSIYSTSLRPGTRNNVVSLGTSSYRWSNVYSTLGNFSSRVLIGNGTDDGSTNLQVNGTSAFYGSTVFGKENLTMQVNFKCPVVAEDRVTIGGATLRWDDEIKALRLNTSLAATGELSAGGAGTEGGNTGGGGTGTITNPYVVNFTPSQETSHSFYHNLPYYDVVVQVYEKNAISGAWDMILADVTIANESRLVTVDFGRKENVEHKIVVR